MSNTHLTMMKYQQWADAELLSKLTLLDIEKHFVQREAAMRLLDHANVVARIFAAHLVRENHDFSSDRSESLPELEALGAAIEETNEWYLRYASTISQVALLEDVPFTFTDGDRGCMSRAEILTHVALHGGYHRGEAGRLLSQIGAELPWDTFAVFLHRSDPSRRLQMSELIANS